MKWLGIQFNMIAIACHLFYMLWYRLPPIHWWVLVCFPIVVLPVYFRRCLSHVIYLAEMSNSSNRLTHNSLSFIWVSDHDKSHDRSKRVYKHHVTIQLIPQQGSQRADDMDFCNLFKVYQTHTIPLF